MKKLVTLTGVLALLGLMTAALAVAGEKGALKSGFAVGENTPPFHVMDVTGPFKGEVCYVCQNVGRPMVMAFLNTEMDEATAIVTQMQRLVAANSKLRAYVVFQGGRELKAEISKLAVEKKISIPMAYLPAGAVDPSLSAYKINPEAKSTILVASKNEVLANFVNLEPSQFQQVNAAARKMVASAE